MSEFVFDLKYAFKHEFGKRCDWETWVCEMLWLFPHSSSCNYGHGRTDFPWM